MTLIEDLGMRYPKESSTTMRRYGLYQCQTCGEYAESLITKKRLLPSSKCKECATKDRAENLKKIAKAKNEKAEEAFRDLADKIHNSMYDYSETVYINDYTKVGIVCRTHGVFMQTPSDHKQGKGCPRCFGNTATQEKASVEFIDKASTTHNGLYDYNLVDYKNSRTKVAIICKMHGVFMQTPNSHIIKGNGCPLCAAYGFDKEKPAILYYLRVKTGNEVLYKIGVTNRTVQERFSKIDLEKIVVIKTWYFNSGINALLEEQHIITSHTNFRYIGEKILDSGNTELFTKDVFGLDTDPLFKTISNLLK